MSYSDETDINITNDILMRKEFQLFRHNIENINHGDEKKNIIPRVLFKDLLEKGNYLELHSYQLFVSNYINPNTRYSRLLIKWETGLGKCLKIDTPILMYDGTIKKVQDVQEGDYLMGDDSTPRKVLSLSRGIDKMYDIIPVKGDKHTVNQEHILCLKFSDKPKMINDKYNGVTWFDPYKITKYKKNFKTPEKAEIFYNEKMTLYNQHKNIVEISVKDYLKLNNTIKQHLKLYKVAVDFSSKEPPFDPYMIGFWLGDSTATAPSITTQDSTVIYYFMKNLQQYNLTLNYSNGYTYNISGNGKVRNNIFLNTLNDYDMLHNKHIPHIYKCNSRETRLKLLAGLIDADGHYRDNCFEFTQKSEKLMNDVIFLCQSLGLACYKKIKNTSWIYKGVKKFGNVYRICIYGEGVDEIPTLIPRKKATKRKQIKDALVTGFKVEYVNEDNYYGFTLDGNRRFLLGDFTVTHNTVGAISLAMNFIEYFKKQEEFDNAFGSVFIIGFTKQIFKDELLKYPEFGFISREELTKLNNIKKQSYAGNHEATDTLKKMLIMFRKRLINRKGNGFFKFYGYKELSNHLFSINKEKINIHSLTDDELKELINKGDITINKEVLNQFSNSLLICDEIHNVYNSLEKNNWGVALQTILNHHKSSRAVFLSATPLNNSPAEIIDLLNLLLPREYYKPLTKSDYFDKQNNLLKGAEDRLGILLKGRISFMRNRNPEFMAIKKFTGEKIKGIDYLKFIRCPMSSFHYNTYKNILDKADTLGQDGQYLMDFVLPDPTEKTPFKALGLYKSSDIKNKLSVLSIKTKNVLGIEYDTQNDLLKGNILSYDKIKIISSKYHHMLSAIFNKIKNNAGKMFIYHNVIHISGTLFIQEILLQNGILDEFGVAVDNTLCSKCGEKRITHSGGHEFHPARFIIVHSNLDKKNVMNSLEKFNHINNIDGSKFLILIGSKIIKESHSINSVRNIMIMSRPDNISTLIQIIGRAVRLNSHKYLSRDKRRVEITIFTSCEPVKKNGVYLTSYEEKRYQNKINTFKVIQNIEKLMHKNAIDAYFNYDNIWRVSDEDKDFGLGIKHYILDKQKYIFKPYELNLSTFNAYHAKFEVNYISFTIKRLFIEISNVWNYEDLFKAVKSPPFDTEINTSLISKDLFNIALTNIIHIESITYDEPEIQNVADTLEYHLLDKLRNPDDKFILLNNKKHIITQMGEYYMLIPFNHELIYADVETLYRIKQVKKTSLINLQEYLKHDTGSNYIDKKERFINKWATISINNLEASLCDFGVKFHQTFLEEIIEYVFNIWTSPKIQKSEYHNFYLKMLYYYDLQKLISWAHMINDELAEKYKKYITPAKEILNQDNELKIKENTGDINLLISTLNKSDVNWISTGMINNYEKKLKLTNDIFDGIYKKKTQNKKISADLLPVGHYFSKIPRYFIPGIGWVNDPTYKPLNIKDIKENDIIIGYDDRIKSGISTKFKIRPPAQNLKNSKDHRLIERGTVCATKSKTFLEDIAKKLRINVGEKNAVDDLCTVIRNKLIYNELKERSLNKKNPIRWFYFSYEVPHL